MSHAGHVVSRSMILEHVWNLTCGGMANVVEVHINRLRKKIEPDPHHPEFLRTAHRDGYCLSVEERG
jgi:DNA-binding response OmpR family regulator